MTAKKDFSTSLNGSQHTGPLPWIKVYVEILTDPKMGRLTDHLFRRVIELFLLAGRTGAGGYLPSTDDIAWELRASAESMLEDMHALEKTGILRNEPGTGWLVVHFAERQDADSNRERQARFRERQRQKAFIHDDEVTKRYAPDNETSLRGDIEGEEEEEKDDIDIESEPPAAAAPSLSFSSAGSLLLGEYLTDEGKGNQQFPSTITKKRWEEAEQRLGLEEVQRAIEHAIGKGIVTVAGITTYLAKWQPQETRQASSYTEELTPFGVVRTQDGEDGKPGRIAIGGLGAPIKFDPSKGWRQ